MTGSRTMSRLLPPAGSRGRPRACLRRRWTAIAVIAALVLPVAACSSSSPTAVSGKKDPGSLQAMLPGEVRAAGIRVLTDPEFRPVSYYDASHVITGTDPQIIRAMARVLGVKVTFTPILQFAGLLTGVQAGRGDIAAGGITDTAAREQAVTFVDDMRLGELFVFARGHEPPGLGPAPMTICGDTVAVTIGAVSASAVPVMSARCSAAGKPAIRSAAFAGVPATIQAVRAGRAQLALYDDLGFGALNAANAGQLQAIRISPYPDQLWGFAVARTGPGRQLARALLAALRAIMASGTYQHILASYGMENDELASPGIDLQGR